MRPDAVKSAALLRQARLRAGLSQQALAEQSGVHRVQINRYEAGAIAPSFDTVIDLVRACGLDLSLELTEIAGGADDAMGELLALSVAERVQRTLDLGAPGDGPAGFHPLAILASLESRVIDYVLIGGLAQVVRGLDLVTGGVDVCPSSASQNLERLSDAVTELGPRRNGVAVTERALDANAVLRINTAAGRLSIVASPAGIPNGYIDLRRAASREDLGDGLRPLVAGTRDLVAMAAALHRRVDTERLQALRRIFELEVDLEPAPEATPSPRRITPRRTLRTSRRIGL